MLEPGDDWEAKSMLTMLSHGGTMRGSAEARIVVPRPTRQSLNSVIEEQKKVRNIAWNALPLTRTRSSARRHMLQHCRSAE